MKRFILSSVRLISINNELYDNMKEIFIHNKPYKHQVIYDMEKSRTGSFHTPLGIAS